MSANEQFVLKKSYLFWLIILVGIIFFFQKISGVLLPFYIAIFISILFSGIVGKIENKFHIPRAFSSALITILFCFFVISCFYALFNISFSKATSSVVNLRNNNDLTYYASMIVGDLLKKFNIENEFNSIISQLSNFIFNYITTLIKNILNYSADILSTTFLCVLSPIVIFMMLKDAPMIGKKIYTLLPINIQKETENLINDIHTSVFNYIEGQTITAMILSVCYAVLLFPLGIEHFILLGILIGFSSFIPYIGFYSATLITLFSSYNQFHDLKRTILTLVLLIIMQIVDSGFITPKIVGDKIGVHPLLIIFGVLVATPIFGFIGVLLALPIIGVAGVIAKFIVKKYKASSYYK